MNETWGRRFRLPTLCRQLAGILTGVVNELSDQTAYKRHLLAHNVEHSAQEWRRFQDQHASATARRARCC